MKKNLFLVAFAAVAMCLGFSSCGDDEELVNKDEVQKTVTAKLVVTPGTNAAFDKVAEVVVDWDIKAGNGDEVRVNSNYPLNGDLCIDDLDCPCTIKLTYRYELKEDAVIDADAEYKLSYGPITEVYTSNDPTTGINKKYLDYYFTGCKSYPSAMEGKKLKEYFDVVECKHTLVINVLKNGTIRAN